mgnify:CR=1 FL=1
MSYEQAQEVLKQNHLKAELTDMIYSDSIEKDRLYIEKKSLDIFARL